MKLKRIRMSKLPRGLIAHDLDLSQTDLKTLPKDLTVTGVLDISETNIIKIPMTIRVNHIHLNGYQLSKFPKDQLAEWNIQEMSRSNNGKVIYCCRRR